LLIFARKEWTHPIVFETIYSTEFQEFLTEPAFCTESRVRQHVINEVFQGHSMYLLDTDTVVFVLRGNDTVVRALAEREDQEMALSVITVGELLVGSRWSTDREAEEQRVRLFCDGFPVLAISEPVIEWFANVKKTLFDCGRPIGDFDLLIAATAMTFGLTLVTNNERHFQRISGLVLDNWLR
jgi:tRNA(fMet)-specific endonuclease VapC